MRVSEGGGPVEAGGGTRGAAGGRTRRDAGGGARGDAGSGAVTCRVVLRYASPEVARTVEQSLRPDNAGFVSTSVDGSAVTAEASAPDPMSLAHTLEDLLACAAAAERIASSVSENKE